MRNIIPSNVLGMLVSSGFESAVKVYILIPLLLIPQMILTGVMLSFDKINDWFDNNEKVPMVADLMASRWAFEALAVQQFKNNKYQTVFYEYDHVEAIANYNMVYVVLVLRDKITRLTNSFTDKNEIHSDLSLIQNELQLRHKLLGIERLDSLKTLCNGKNLLKKLITLDAMVKKLEDKYHKL